MIDGLRVACTFCEWSAGTTGPWETAPQILHEVELLRAALVQHVTAHHADKIGTMTLGAAADRFTELLRAADARSRPR